MTTYEVFTGSVYVQGGLSDSVVFHVFQNQQNTSLTEGSVDLGTRDYGRFTIDSTVPSALLLKGQTQRCSAYDQYGCLSLPKLINFNTPFSLSLTPTQISGNTPTNTDNFLWNLVAGTDGSGNRVIGGTISANDGPVTVSVTQTLNPNGSIALAGQLTHLPLTAVLNGFIDADALSRGVSADSVTALLVVAGLHGTSKDLGRF